MKFLYITDTHLRYYAPRSRTDLFFETLVKKMEEIGDIIQRENVTALLHGGDLFDRPDAQIAVAGKFASILMNYGVPIYIISGNHDSFGQNPSTIDRSMLGLLASLGVVHLLDNESVLLEEGDLHVEVHGTPFHFDLDRDPKNYFYERDPRADYSLQLVHGFLLDRPFIKGIHFTLIDEIENTNADLVLAGHYHSGFPVTTRKGTTFINPGSLVRMSNTTTERSRIPKAILIDLKIEDGTVVHKITEIPLQSAKPGEMVMVDKDPIDYKFKNQAIESFEKMIQKDPISADTNLLTALITIAKKAEIPSEILEEAEKRLDRAQKVVNNDHEI